MRTQNTVSVIHVLSSKWQVSISKTETSLKKTTHFSMNKTLCSASLCSRWNRFFQISGVLVGKCLPIIFPYLQVWWSGWFVFSSHNTGNRKITKSLTKPNNDSEAKRLWEIWFLSCLIYWCSFLFSYDNLGCLYLWKKRLIPWASKLINIVN